MSALALQHFLRSRRQRVVRPTAELWRRVRRMARGEDDAQLVEQILLQPGWGDLEAGVSAPLPLLVRELGAVEPVAAACACALLAGGVLEGAVPAQPRLLESIASGIVRWRATMDGC